MMLYVHFTHVNSRHIDVNIKIISWIPPKFVLGHYTVYLGKVKQFKIFSLKDNSDTNKKSRLGS